MTEGPCLETGRLVLRRWQESDLEPFAAMNMDPAVMEFFPSLLSRDESDSLARRADGFFDEAGYGLFAVEVKDGPAFVGFVGLAPLSPSQPMPFEAEAEVGWRLASSAWGRGYASEAARASAGFGFSEVGLPEIVSFTAVVNKRSQRVMEKLGMQRDLAEDFEHPRLAAGHVLRPHVLYRLSSRAWASACGSPATLKP